MCIRDSVRVHLGELSDIPVFDLGSVVVSVGPIGQLNRLCGADSEGQGYDDGNSEQPCLSLIHI